MLYSRAAKLVDDGIWGMHGTSFFFAMLDVPDCNHFQVRFTDVHRMCSIGIAPRFVFSRLADPSTEMPRKDIYTYCGHNGAFSFDVGGRVFCPGIRPFPNIPVEVTVIKMRYIDGELAFSFNESDSWVKFAIKIPATAEYSPIIFAETFEGDDENYLLCKFRVSLKRRCTDHLLANQHKRLYIACPFTDAIVVCGAERFLVHRAVLSVASPVFQRAFAGPMTEGGTAKFEIRTHPSDAVKAMLKFVYTGNLSGQILVSGQLASLLHLAVQYALDDLIALSASTMARRICPGNVKEWAQALKLHQEHIHVRQAFAEVVEKMQADKPLLIALV